MKITKKKIQTTNICCRRKVEKLIGRKQNQKNAEIVYSHKKHNGKKTALAKRTNDFEMLEKLCKQY